MTIVYAVGLTHHTTGGQLIRSGALLQLILGNMGRPGGGMNAERGHANIQGNTDNAISWEILPGYLKIPAPGQKTIDDYVKASASKKLDPNSWNFFGTNYRKFMVSPLKAWYGDAATKANEFAFDYVPKPGVNSSWMSIYDQALKGKMEGVMLSGMTATSIGPDSNQVLQALSNLKWLVVMDPLPTTSSEFWRAPGTGQRPDRSLHAPDHPLDREGRFIRQQRPLVAVEGPGHPAGRRSAPRSLDHGRAALARQGALREGRRQVPRPDHAPDDGLQGSAQAGARRDRARGQWQRPQDRQTDGNVRQAEGRRHDDRRRLDLHRQLPREREHVQAPQRRAGPEEKRSHRHGLLPQLGVELAAQPPRPLQPRLGGSQRKAVGSQASRHHVERRESGSATSRTTRRR